MASIQTGIELNDQFSGVLNNIINSVNLAVSAMTEMQQSMNADIDTSSIEGARDEINQATAALNAMSEAANRQTAPDVTPPVVDTGNDQVVNVDVNPVLPDPLVENPEPIRPEIQPNAPPEPVQVPVEWQTDGLDVFTGTGIERFQQEIQSADNMLNTLNSTQQRINQTASGVDILPDAAMQDLSNMGQRLQAIQQRIQQIESNPVNMGTDVANAGLEQLRAQLNSAIQSQNDLNAAMENMDVSGANAAYLQLSQTVSNTERYIRDNTDEQGQFNQQIQEGTSQADKLTSTIKSAVAAYVSFQSVKAVLDMSDELTSTTSRLDMMNDGLQTTDELVNMVYAAAQDARGSFSDMAAVVAKFGNNAGDAFSSSAEVVEFADLVQKQMTIAGASTTEASNAMLQLSQALGSGVLRGDELNSIFEQAPNLIQSIADYLDVPIGSIREMASEGELSADIVKQAIFAASDDINAKFESMPMTFSQIWQSFKNTALIAFQPVLNRLNDIANSTAFQTFVNNAIGLMATLANVVLNIFDLIGQVGSFVSENWSIISPIIYGVIAALAVYAAYLGIVKAAEIASAAAKAIHAVAMSAQIGVTALLTGQTMAATAAQMGYNGALYACPIVWIIVLIIALIAVIYAVCAAIAKMTGIANSGFGVITGGVNVVIQFFKNLGLTVANIALGIGNAIAALASNMMTAFHNAIASIQAWFYDLLSTALTTIAGICEALNNLPFVDFDYSGITSAASDYAAKSAAATDSKEDYTSVVDAFKEGMSTYDTYQDGWASDAFNAGASWDDGVADSVANAVSGLTSGASLPSVSDYTSGLSSGVSDALTNSGVGDSLGSIADDTGSISDSMDITSEDLKYLRDIAEQEAVNRYTTAEINVDMSGMQNTVNSGDDIDGFMNKLTDSVNEAVDNMTEGVHK